MSEEQSVTILYDHYKDTCSTIGQAVKRRDRLMVFVVLALGFFAFQSIFPTASNTAVNDFLNFKFGLTHGLDLAVVGNVVWFLLLIFTLRYFQVAVFVERQYDYIHKVEDQLNAEFGKELVTREGKSYLGKYPVFSDWMWMLYTIIFPLLLLVVATVKIIGEFAHVCNTGWTFGLALNGIAFVLLTLSVVLYMIMIHSKSRKS